MTYRHVMHAETMKLFSQFALHASVFLVNTDQQQKASG